MDIVEEAATTPERNAEWHVWEEEFPHGFYVRYFCGRRGVLDGYNYYRNTIGHLVRFDTREDAEDMLTWIQEQKAEAAAKRAALSEKERRGGRDRG